MPHVGDLTVFDQNGHALTTVSPDYAKRALRTGEIVRDDEGHLIVGNLRVTSLTDEELRLKKAAAAKKAEKEKGRRR